MKEKEAYKKGLENLNGNDAKVVPFRDSFADNIREIHSGILAEEKKMAHLVIDALDEAELIAEELKKVREYRQRQIDQAGRLRGFFLRLKFKLVDLAALFKIEAQNARKRLSEHK